MTDMTLARWDCGHELIAKDEQNMGNNGLPRCPFCRIAELEELLALAGAQQRDDGEWVWPYYVTKDNRLQVEWLATEEWKDLRVQASGAIASVKRLLRDV